MSQGGGHNILVFDSGLGGLSLIPEIRNALPDASLLYMADNALFPYGDLTEQELTARLVDLFNALVSDQDITAAVIACNTASTVILDVLRANFPFPFVGTVPAIKPACAMSKTGRVSVLATPGTVSRAYTQNLISEFAGDVSVHLHGSAELARIAEGKLMGQEIDEDSLFSEMSPAFRKDQDAQTDVIVLGCTHYPLLKEEMTRLAPWPVTFLDTSQAIARRLSDIVAKEQPTTRPFVEQVILTAHNSDLAPVFTPFGFHKMTVLSV